MSNIGRRWRDDSEPDLEKVVIDRPRAPALSHYDILEKMVNYHAIDFGNDCEARRFSYV